MLCTFNSFSKVLKNTIALTLKNKNNKNFSDFLLLSIGPLGLAAGAQSQNNVYSAVYCALCARY